MSLLSLSPLLSSLFVSYANRAAALESASATPSPESEDWKALQTTIVILQEENEKLKSTNREMMGKLAAAEASQEAFCSQVSSLKEVCTTQQDDIKSLQEELVEARGKYDRLVVDSNAEKAALQIRVLDLEVSLRFCLVGESIILIDTPCGQAHRVELKEAVVEQQVRISKLERRLPDDIPPVMSTRRSPSPPARSRSPYTLSPTSPRSPISRLQTPLPDGGEPVPSLSLAGPFEVGGPYAPPFPGPHRTANPHPVSRIPPVASGPGCGGPRQQPSKSSLDAWYHNY